MVLVWSPALGHRAIDWLKVQRAHQWPEQTAKWNSGVDILIETVIVDRTSRVLRTSAGSNNPRQRLARRAQLVHPFGHLWVFDQRRRVMRFRAGVDHQ